MKKFILLAIMACAIAFLNTGCIEVRSGGWRISDYPDGTQVCWDYQGGPPCQDMVYGDQGWYYPGYSAVLWEGSWCWAPGYDGQVYFDRPFIRSAERSEVRFQNPYRSGGQMEHGDRGVNHAGGDHFGGQQNGGGQSFHNPYQGGGQGGNHNGGNAGGGHNGGSSGGHRGGSGSSHGGH